MVRIWQPSQSRLVWTTINAHWEQYAFTPSKTLLSLFLLGQLLVRPIHFGQFDEL